MNISGVTTYNVTLDKNDVTLHPSDVTLDHAVTAPAMIVHVQFAHALENMTFGTAVYSSSDPLNDDRYVPFLINIYYLINN